MQKRHIGFVALHTPAQWLSIVLVVASIACFGVFGLNYGIDFTGGTLVEVEYAQAVDLEDVRDTLATAGYEDAVAQNFGTSRNVLIRLPASEQEEASRVGAEIVRVLQAGGGDDAVALKRVDFVGPQVGVELRERGGMAMLLALAAIFVYVMFRFEWKFSAGAVAALFHDVIITIGLFSALQLDFDLSVLAALLAVIGYSLNDTIVVYDRIRENFRKMRKRAPPEVVDGSLNQTLARTLMTSFTTLLVLVSLALLGGDNIFGFAVALIFGVIIGTYSSIFVASNVILRLGISREDLLQQVEKEGAGADVRP